MNVHESMLDEYLAKGYVIVETMAYERSACTSDRHYDSDHPCGACNNTKIIEPFTRYELADPATTCMHKMRGWSVHIPAYRGYDDVHMRPARTETSHGFCLLDKGHKGRHSTVVFTCDNCDKTRRGSPAFSDPDSVTLCFMCHHPYTHNFGHRRKKEHA